MRIVEALRFAYQNLNVNRMRGGLTMLGMVIGTASIILVVTIALTGKDYILQQIEAVGTNLIYFYYEASGDASDARTLSDDLTLGDLEAVQQLPGVAFAAGIVTTSDRVTIAGKEKEVSVIGVTDRYARVRNLRILSGRFWDEAEAKSYGKLCLITEEFARKLYGSLDIRGKSIRLYQVPFEVVGVFQEGVATFGQSEVTALSVILPLQTLRRFTGTDKLNLIYASARTSAVVPRTTELIVQLLERRHRKGSSYRVENMTEILRTADRIASVLTMVLFLIGTITLVISGIGIMNIMLVTVVARTREIGIRMATGARRREILFQFLTESVFLSTTGGTLGILLGLSGPLIAKLGFGFDIPISWIAIAIAFSLSVIVGVSFGIMPAHRAAKLDPTEALRYE